MPRKPDRLLLLVSLWFFAGFAALSDNLHGRPFQSGEFSEVLPSNLDARLVYSPTSPSDHLLAVGENRELLALAEVTMP